MDISFDAEIQHMLQALAWKNEFNYAQHATPQVSRQAYAILLETNAKSSDSQPLFENMGGSQSR
jgi:hypothetical protein